MKTLTVRSSASPVRHWLTRAAFASIIAIHMSTQAHTFIRPDPGSSKELLYLRGNEIFTDFKGKRVLFVDAGDIRPEPGGKRLLMVDATEDVRRESHGVRLATWSGNELRRRPGGKLLALIDGNDVRPQAGFKRYFSVEGDELSKVQLTAVLFKLKPELFTLTQEEEASALAEIKEGEESERKEASAEHEAGEFMVLAASGPWERKGFHMTFNGDHLALASKDGAKLTGAGVKFQESGYHVIGGMGTGSYQVGLFEYKDGQYVGRWIAKAGTPAAKLPKDAWKTKIGAGGTFASKQGQLTLTATNKDLNGEGKIFSVTTDKGQTGFAYYYGNAALGAGLVITLGEGSGVYRFQARGGLVGDYYGGETITGMLNMTQMNP